VAERTAEEIRREIAGERARLEQSQDALLAELRSFVPVVVIGLIALGAFTAQKGLRKGLRVIERLS
jgi:hypothetical protein